jgi:hypothetical protein
VGCRLTTIYRIVLQLHKRASEAKADQQATFIKQVAAMFLTSRFFFVDESAVVSALGTECGAQNKS